MERERKRTEVTQLTETFATAKSAVVLGFKGLTVNKDTLFRKQIRDSKAKYRVSKNTLLRLAVKGTAFDGLSKHFKEVSAVATTEFDVVGMVSAINNFLKDNPGVDFKGAILDGKEVSFSDFKIIAELPSREVLIGRLLYLMRYPITGIAVVLDAICKQKEGAA
jgi:large subunit ribosomal protein L10